MAIRFIHQGKHYKKVELMGADNRKAIFTGCVRDCQPYLEKVLKNIDRISDCFSESAYIFVENDSTDGSKKILQQWASGKQGATIVNLDGLDKVPARTARLEFARNTFVEIIRSRPQLHTYDYMIVLDMDDINAAQLNPNQFDLAIEFLKKNKNNAAVFSSQKGLYYDLWTLRHTRICPTDIWEEVYDCWIDEKITEAEAFNKIYTKKLFSLDGIEDPIEVDSAFGGIGIYKMKWVLKNKNPYLGYKYKIIKGSNGNSRVSKFQQCEHVHFNYGLGLSGGKMFIFPNSSMALSSRANRST